MKVSVALAYYNGGKYIEEQLSSILKQLQPGDEVIISVDGATDGSMELLEKLAGEDERIMIIEGPGKGVVKNFEHAIGACTGDVIFLSDQDDVWKEDKVKKVTKIFEKTDVDVVLHNASMIDGEGKEMEGPTMFDLRKSRPGIVKNLVRNCYIGCCMAFRGDIKDALLPIPEKMYMHDYWIGTLGEKLGGVGLLKECLIRYRRHEENVTDMTHGSVSFMIKKRLDMVRCLRIMKKRLAQMD